MALRMGIARLNVMRLNYARLEVFQPFALMTINGVNVTAHIRIDDASVSYQLNHAPDTLRVRVGKAVTPIAGQLISLYIGLADQSHLLFYGRILEVTALYEGEIPALVAYDVYAIDPTWLVNRQRATWQYANMSASDIAQNVLAQFTRGFSGGGIVPNLPVIDEITFTNEEVADCMTRIAQRIGGYWYVDYNSNIHLFLDEGLKALPITQAQPYGSRGHTLDEDISQVVTKVIGRGGGAQAVVDAPVGATMIPIADASWYSPSGGVVESGPQRITYTGVSGTGEGGANITIQQITPSMPPNAEIGTAQPPGLSPTWYYLAYTYRTASGETMIGPVKQLNVSVANCGIGIWAYLDFPAPGTPPLASITKLECYVGQSPGPANMKRLSYAITFPITEPINFSDYWYIESFSAASGPAPPTTNTSGLPPIPIPPGSPALTVDDLAPFPDAGWVLAGGQYLLYTGKSAASGVGSLTGIPPSGSGAITAPIREGVVRLVPHLTGIPASGPGSIYFPIKTGDEVTIRYEETDTAAAHDMAVRLGSGVDADGVFEDTFSDGRFGITELTANVRAILTDRSTPIKNLTFETRDHTCEVGATVTIALTTPAITGTYRIQSVTLSEIGIAGKQATWAPPPLRRVTASNKLYSMQDLVRRWRLGGSV